MKPSPSPAGRERGPQAPGAARRLFPFPFPLLLGAWLLAGPALAAPLPAEVAAALQAAGIAPAGVGIVVQAVDAERPRLAHNARTAFNPASTMKLVTTYAGLELLGPAHTWQTEALSDAAPENGQLAGDLYLRGSGDPSLTLERFWLLLRQLRARGVGDIAGDVVFDRSAFALPPHDPAEFDNAPLRPYNAGPDALLVNFKSLRLTLTPDAARQTVGVASETPADGLQLSQHLTLGKDEACGDWREKLTISVDDARIDLAGAFPAACGEKTLHLAPWPADEQAGRLFRALWRELGGTLRGKVRAGATPAGARTLAVQTSPPLADVVRDINKFSNNVMARQLFLSLSAERPATPDGARRRIGEWLTGTKREIPGLVLENGAGLSRHERVSAAGLAQLLLAAWASPAMPELMASLPIAGVDGTLKNRFGETAATGRAHLKTGSLANVRAIAGYVQDSRQRRWVVVCLINDPKAGKAVAAIEALVRWVAEDRAATRTEQK